MRTLVLTALACFFSYSLLEACSCISSSYCEQLENYNDDNDLIFRGSFIQRVPLDVIFYAVQYKVEEIFVGEIVTPNSPLYMNEEFVNTDSTVWVISANSSICLPYLEENEAILVIGYKENQAFGDLTAFGYSVSACEPNYFVVSDDGSTVVGNFYDQSDEIELLINEFSELTQSQCGQQISSENDISVDDFQIYPQPTSDILKISSSFNLNEWQISLLNLQGRPLRSITETELDLSHLQSGIYLIQFVKNRQRQVMKVVKM